MMDRLNTIPTESGMKINIKDKEIEEKKAEKTVVRIVTGGKTEQVTESPICRAGYILSSIYNCTKQLTMQ